MRFSLAHRFGMPSWSGEDTPASARPPRPLTPRPVVSRAVGQATRRVRAGGRVARQPTAQQRRDARDLLRGSIYDGVTFRVTPANQHYSAREILNFCLDLGELMLTAGADTRSVEVAVVAVCSTWNLLPMEIDLASESIYLMYTPADGQPIVTMRVIRTETSDLGRVDRLHRVVEQVVLEGTGLAEATRSLSGVAQLPPRWGPQVMTVATAVLAVSVALQCGGSPRAALAAFLLVCVVTEVSLLLSRRGLPAFFAAGAQAAIAGAFATVAIYTELLTAGGAAASLAACLVLLLPHASIVTFGRDAITGFKATAASRSIGIGLVIMGILFGLQLGLSLTRELPVQVDPTDIRLHPLGLGLAALASAIAASANCIAQGSAARVIPAAALACVLAQLVLRGCLHAGLGNTEATFLAATALGAACTWWAARQHTSATVYAVPAFCGALLPALPVADSLLNLVAHTPNSGWRLAIAVLSTLSIGAGLVMGGLLATGGARRVVRSRVRSLDTAIERPERTVESPVPSVGASGVYGT
ncbi:threonine/serine exporter family protein [Allobranchiibius sp. CTAmp26]|uniref:threonine/serine exporter family protein n=1 Tax=Allobranchiibius sp. CTAmp26 TaxID=2815214 RepID=UPI001AA12E38|nr:threonine/serine exporter family protein [Allobranchiibius sp. CTAmp26]MBO1755955.1 threonine/serine exporter family protein [Allobranchiibius sp. CTAmp26]